MRERKRAMSSVSPPSLHQQREEDEEVKEDNDEDKVKEYNESDGEKEKYEEKKENRE